MVRKKARKKRKRGLKEQGEGRRKGEKDGWKELEATVVNETEMEKSVLSVSDLSILFFFF